MNDRQPPLTPWTLNQLLGRVAKEWSERNEIFSLAGRRFFHPPEGVDLSCSVGGGRAATPVGPAAGPHTQLAQNIVLSWLAGARTFELKTVQVLDDLDIARPCIDMENVGYNVEWSQELSLEESLEEYAKSALMLAVLRRWEPLRDYLGADDSFFDHVLELSCGYDLNGIQSPKMHAFLTGMLNAGERIDRLRGELPEPFAHLRDVPVSPKLVNMTNLSTFHGCPPDEIEGIVRYLMTEHGLDVTVKLNPTLLGEDTVAEILHDRLGYTDVKLVPSAFAEDLKFDRAVEMIRDLNRFAQERQRRFGIKLTNTLVVENHREVLPEERMYLSGPPLHVLAVTLLDRLAAALPGMLALGEAGPVPVAFSAGIDKNNLGSAVALGLEPVTICSDLLKPGGYGRMAAGLKKLARTLRDEGLSDLPALRSQALAAAKKAGSRDSAQAAARSLISVEGARPYTLAKTGKALRQVDHDLEMFDCVACNNCVTVCPNNAFITVPSGNTEGFEARDQYLVLAELCNDCGNCTTFCPERGAPQRTKPRLYTKRDVWDLQDGKGFLLSNESGAWHVTGGAAEASEAASRVQTLTSGADGDGGLPLAGCE